MSATYTWRSNMRAAARRASGADSEPRGGRGVLKRRLHLLVGAVLVLTAVVLFLVVPGVGGTAKSHYSLDFADDYGVLANSLATGQGYRLRPQLEQTMMPEPGYPLFLAGVFKVLGYGLSSAAWRRLASRRLPRRAAVAIA